MLSKVFFFFLHATLQLKGTTLPRPDWFMTENDEKKKKKNSTLPHRGDIFSQTHTLTPIIKSLLQCNYYQEHFARSKDETLIAVCIPLSLTLGK